MNIATHRRLSAIRQWCQEFGQKYSHQIKKSMGPLGDTWYRDEVFIKINVVQHYLWRAVVQDGDELDILVQERQMRRFKSQKHAQRFLACHGIVNNLFRLGRHMMKAKNYKILRERSFVEWERVSCVQNLV